MNTNIIRKNAAFFAKYICNDINASIRSSNFHNELKEADIVPVHKKKSKLSKENYRPISILPNMSKVYERCLYGQTSEFFDNIFSKYQCGFRKAYSAQHCLLVMIMECLWCIINRHLKLLIAFRMTLSLPNWKHMVFK